MLKRLNMVFPTLEQVLTSSFYFFLLFPILHPVIIMYYRVSWEKNGRNLHCLAVATKIFDRNTSNTVIEADLVTTLS